MPAASCEVHYLIARYEDVNALLRDRRFGRTYLHREEVGRERDRGLSLEAAGKRPSPRGNPTPKMPGGRIGPAWPGS
jgi:hypothetical protein